MINRIISVTIETINGDRDSVPSGVTINTPARSQQYLLTFWFFLLWGLAQMLYWVVHIFGRLELEFSKLILWQCFCFIFPLGIAYRAEKGLDEKVFVDLDSRWRRHFGMQICVALASVFAGVFVAADWFISWNFDNVFLIIYLSYSIVLIISNVILFTLPICLEIDIRANKEIQYESKFKNFFYVSAKPNFIFFLNFFSSGFYLGHFL